MIQPLTQISAPTRALAGYIGQAPKLRLPALVAEKARHHILDTMAAMVSGARLAPGRAAIAYVRRLGGMPQASVAGSKIVTSCVNAALANGMLAHADETDDSHAPSRNHPGCAVVPAALAAAEPKHASGEQFLRAVVLGYDVAARLNYALGADAFAFAGRMTHSFGGTFGAGAAAAALLGLDALQAQHLLSYCAQQASGVGSSVRDADHIEKAFDFGGMPARNGRSPPPWWRPVSPGSTTCSAASAISSRLTGRRPIRASSPMASAGASRSSVPTSRNGRPARRHNRPSMRSCI